MKIIDAHMHFSKIASFRECGDDISGVDYSAHGYLAEAEACGITRSICMGLSEIPPSEFPDKGAKTPMLADLSDAPPEKIALCMGINPHTLSPDAIRQMEGLVAVHSATPTGVTLATSPAVATTPAPVAPATSAPDPVAPAPTTSISTMPTAQIVGIKIYAGYYHFDVNDTIYAPAFDFAERHNLAVVIHSGDTYSEKGKLIYSQPLSIDSLAVDRPDLRIVICHMGAPWIYDACEVAGKNRNVYMDLSGLYVGNAEFFGEVMSKTPMIDRYRQALMVMDKYDKLLFGTDWPLAPMASYIEFCKTLVPPETWPQVFYENALRVFNLG